MASFKNYNLEIQSRLDQAMEQYKAAESLLHDLEANREAADTVIGLHDSAIKGVKKEMLRLERQMAKDSLKQINNLERAGVRLVDSDYLAGSYVKRLVEKGKLKDGKDDITPDKLNEMDNEKLFNALEQYKKDNLSPIRASLDKAIDAGHQVTETSKEVMNTLKQDGIDLKDAAVAAGIDAKLAANEARLGFMRKTKDLTQGIKHQFDRLNDWRKEHGLTFHDINEALKADRQEYKEKFAERWDGIKDSFNNTVEKVHDSIQEYKDFQAVQQMEAERQMNMRLISIDTQKANYCNEKITKLMHRREKIIGTVNKAILLGNKAANMARETFGYDTKEANLPDVAKSKMYDKKILQLEKERVIALKAAALNTAKNIQITNQEMEYSKTAVERARNQSFRENDNKVIGQIGNVKIERNPFIVNYAKSFKHLNTVDNEKYAVNTTFGQHLKHMFDTDAIENKSSYPDFFGMSEKTFTPITQTLYNIDQLVSDQETKEWIVDVSTDKDNNFDLDKAMSLAIAHKSGIDLNELQDRTADEITSATYDTLDNGTKEQEDFVKGADQYLIAVDKNPDRAIDNIVKDVKSQDDKEIIEAIKNDEFLDVTNKPANLYIVETSAEVNKQIIIEQIEQSLLPEEDQDKDFLDRIRTDASPSYASIDNPSVGFKVFTRPTDALAYADAVKRNTGMDVKAFGTTEMAKNWLTNMSQEAKFGNIGKDNVKDTISKVEINQNAKTVKIKDDDEMEL